MPQAARHRSVPVLILLAVVALVVAACADGRHEVRSVPAPGWPVYGGDPANANFTEAVVPGDLALSWRRDAGGPVIAPLSVSNERVIATTAPGQGCNFMALSPDNGRKLFCLTMQPGVQTQTAALDRFEQPYAGEGGVFLAFNGGGSIRWRTEVLGVPQPAKFAGPGMILMVTTHGQLMLLDGQNGDPLTPEVRLRPDLADADDLLGYTGCGTSPDCAVAAPAAVDTRSERFYLNYWPAGGTQAQLTAFDYAPSGDDRSISESWTATLPGGMVGPATVSADGETVYAFSRTGLLYALDARTGDRRWEYDLGRPGFGTLAVSPGGLIIPAGDLDAPVVALQDRGTSAEQVWRRDDLRTGSLSTITESGGVWTVVRSDDEALTLRELSASDGTDRRDLPMPGGTGFTTGVAISAEGAVVTVTHSGTVYYFAGG